MLKASEVNSPQTYFWVTVALAPLRLAAITLIVSDAVTLMESPVVLSEFKVGSLPSVVKNMVAPGSLLLRVTEYGHAPVPDAGKSVETGGAAPKGAGSNPPALLVDSKQVANRSEHRVTSPIRRICLGPLFLCCRCFPAIFHYL
jgi:hypothetical protein